MGPEVQTSPQARSHQPEEMREMRGVGAVDHVVRRVAVRERVHPLDGRAQLGAVRQRSVRLNREADHGRHLEPLGAQFTYNVPSGHPNSGREYTTVRS